MKCRYQLIKNLLAEEPVVVTGERNRSQDAVFACLIDYRYTNLKGVNCSTEPAYE